MLFRSGFRREASQIFEGMFAAATYVDLMRLPELFCGFPRRRSQGPTFYPVACSPQAWSAATPLSLLQSCLGIRFDIGAGTIALCNPILPPFLQGLYIGGLRLGEGSVELGLDRIGDTVVVRPISRQGDVRIISMA